MDAEELQCYNRGCGKKYKLGENVEEACRHHPGEPFFHDAYKGWTCCNKKCTDFTEFLNIPGCTLSLHSNIKPPEPEKQVKSDVPDDTVIEVKPLVPNTMKRPPFESPMTLMKAEVAPSLRQNSTVNSVTEKKADAEDTGEVAVGTLCKNGGCNVSYEGPDSDDSPCLHHPGYPVFHEGMKFWSCCMKRTSDFNAFLSQLGCVAGKHLWIKEDKNDQAVKCRWDYHQTGTHVIVSIYAKQYCPDKSRVKLNPIRLYANIVFPQQSNAAFNLDFELRGIVDVANSQVNMYGTKVEIKLKKAEPGSWAQLEIPREVTKAKEDHKEIKSETIDKLETQVESVDLTDL